MLYWSIYIISLLVYGMGRWRVGRGPGPWLKSRKGLEDMFVQQPSSLISSIRLTGSLSSSNQLRDRLLSGEGNNLTSVRWPNIFRICLLM